MALTVAGPLPGQSALCERVLRALPDWFGIEQSIQDYIRAVSDLPTFLARADGQEIGFLSLKQHYPETAEIYVMGVLPAWQGRGAGGALVAAAEAHLRQSGVQVLQVKTLAETHPDPFYARTRAFYRKMGFAPLEVLDLWGTSNPCLLMVKALSHE